MKFHPSSHILTSWIIRWSGLILVIPSSPYFLHPIASDLCNFAPMLPFPRDGKTEKLFSKSLTKAILCPDFPVAHTPHTYTFFPYTFPEQFIQGASESKKWYMEHRLLDKGEELKKNFLKHTFCGANGNLLLHWKKKIEQA